MKKLLSFFSVILVILSVSLVPAYADYTDDIKEDIYSPVYMLVSLDDSTVLFSKGSEKKCAPATFVKIINAITVIESCSDLDATVTVSGEALDILGYSYSAVTSELSAGEKMTVKQLLYCCMLQSANDAANALAWYCGKGDVDAFIKKMNSTVKKIGCTGTVIKNATGVDADGQYTTAQDMVKIISYGLTLPVFKEIFEAISVDIPATNKHDARKYYTGNEMVFSTNGVYYYEYVTGGKSGATDKAGRVFAATAAKDGYTYLAVVMKGERKAFHENGERLNLAALDAKTMFEWAFKNIRLKTVANTSQVITVVNVKAGKDTDHVRLIPAKDVSALVPANTDYTSVLIEPIEDSVKENVTAPVKKGDVLGEAKILFSGKEIARVELVAAENVRRSTVRFVGTVIYDIIHSTPFKIVAGSVIGLIVAFILLTLGSNIKEKRNKKSRQNRQAQEEDKKP